MRFCTKVKAAKFCANMLFLLVVLIAVLIAMYKLRVQKIKGAQQLSVPKYELIITEQGYLFEKHKIRTLDGYINTAWRIRSQNSLLKRPVIINHGLLDNCYSFLALNKTHALPYLLADEGYDVWLTNNRGSTFSIEHEVLDSWDFGSSFWDFSFDELAKFDLPAHVQYVLDITKTEKIDFIGHSQGAFQFMMAYTVDSTFLESRINKFVALGTVPKFIEIVKQIILNN